MPSGRSIFAIGRRELKKEDQLTEMLAWLMDVVPAVRHRLVEMAFGEPIGDDETQVRTQAGIATGRLDALLIDTSFALVIESKLDSDFHDDQIKRYLDWLQETHAGRERRGLMTLTKHPVPEDRRKELAAREDPKVAGSARLWEELHEQLGSLGDSSDLDALSSRLVGEFLVMLSEEELIPMKPIAADEFTSWSEAAATVKRFHEFFSKCKEAIGSALAAKPISNSARHAYAYQDYLWDDGDRIVVGIDAGEWEPRHAVTLWMAVEAKHRDDWDEIRKRLDTTAPEGWTSGKPWWWGERPIVWRYLDDAIGAGTFDQQRKRLAKACSVGANWLRTAEAGRTPPLEEPSAHP